MKRIMALVLLMLLFAAAGLAEDEAGTIVQSSCSIVFSDGYYMAYCFAQVHNDTDQVLCLDTGTYYLESGEEIIAAEEISQLWPYFLAPGEDGYLFDIVPFDQMPQVTGIDYDISYMTIDPDYAGQRLETDARVELDDGSGLMSVICEIHNPESVDAYDPTIVVGLYTDAGQLLYSDGRSLKDVALPVGGKLLVRFAVDPLLTEQWAGYGALPTQVRAGAMFRTGSD